MLVRPFLLPYILFVFQVLLRRRMTSRALGYCFCLKIFYIERNNIYRYHIFRQHSFKSGFYLLCIMATISAIIASLSFKYIKILRYNIQNSSKNENNL